jgi:spermidine synthase
MGRMLSGANVYFGQGFGGYERLRFFEEDRAGGMVAVVEQAGQRTLLSNAKFEGNDGFEVPDQQMFALLPLLFVKHYGRAVNIGVGTGNTLATLAAFPFETVEAVDLSAAVLDAARLEFPHINEDVFEDPRVSVHVEDGRTFLETSDRLYDVVSMQLSSIWIGGTAELYNAEFYEVVKRRLTPGGVLQQWVQLHHIDPLDVARIMGTLRSVFPHVTLWVAGYQGVLVASMEPLRADAQALDRWAGDPKVGPLVKTSGLLHPFAAFGHLYLDEAGVDSFLAEAAVRAGVAPDRLISRDDHPVLEYSTPRGNLLKDALGDNMERLRGHATASPLRHVENLTDDAERRALLAYAAHARGFTSLARRVAGPVLDQLAAGPHAALAAALRGAPAEKFP